MDAMDTSLLTRSLNFHGQQLQKIWESERGENDLSKRNLKDLNFQIYGQRQKSLSFQDRAKRLKLQQFIVKNAESLFANDNDILYGKPCSKEENVSEETYAVMPPLELYINVDKQKRLEYFFENVRIGDLILGTIVSKTQAGMMLKVLCTSGVNASIRYVADINIKTFHQRIEK